MLTAKLFTGLAIVSALCGWVLKHRSARSIDIVLHATYFVIGHFDLLLSCTLSCVVFAGLYFAGARWMPNPPSQTLGLLQFAVMTLAVILFVVFGLIGTPDFPDAPSVIPRVHMYTYTALAGILSLLLSWAVFVVNLGWAVVRAIRVR